MIGGYRLQIKSFFIDIFAENPESKRNIVLVKKLYWFLFVHDLNDSPVKSTVGAGRSLKNKLINDVALVVLLSYALVVFNPFIVLLSDVIAHTFWEKEHLMTEHQAHGKNHVEFEITKAEKQTEKDKSKSNTKSGAEDFYHILVFNTITNFSAFQLIKQSFAPLKFHYPVSYPDVDYPPPRR